MWERVAAPKGRRLPKAFHFTSAEDGMNALRSDSIEINLR
jgi:hypothetical protein